MHVGHDVMTGFVAAPSSSVLCVPKFNCSSCPLLALRVGNVVVAFCTSSGIVSCLHALIASCNVFDRICKNNHGYYLRKFQDTDSSITPEIQRRL
jgi:hypothetical protein